MPSLKDLSSFSTLTERELEHAALVATLAGDPAAMIATGGEYERRGAYHMAWPLLARGAEANKPSSLPQWDGEPAENATLLVRRKMRHLGAELRMARFLIPAAHAFGKVIVKTEPRLVSLLSRTFPEVHVLADDGTGEPSADFEASYERLAMFYGNDASQITRAFRTLKLVDSDQRAPAETLGIAWHSSNSRKPLPSLGDWSAALGLRDLSLASLQYDEEKAGFEKLCECIGRGIASSAPIDQMTDVDGFCQQVAGMSGVLTISNTTAHVAGMLGVPCVVLLDDFQHLTWPRKSDHSPFYPNLRTIRPEGRLWVDVINAGIDLCLSLQSMTRE
jgi:hypothetical protein